MGGGGGGGGGEGCGCEDKWHHPLPWVFQIAEFNKALGT